MTKFAPVCPPHILKYLQDNFMMGDYHLLLAHDVVQKPEQYSDIFHKDHGMTVIMDNSVIELGTAVDLHMIADAARLTHATHIVLPDTLTECDKTLFDCTQALDTWGEFFANSLEHDWSFMFVPQGKTLKEWTHCLETFYEEQCGRVGIWGIPRILTDTPGIETRRTAIEIARAVCSGIQLHMLGFSDNVIDDILCARELHPDEGIDSAVPLRIASLNMEMRLSLGVLPPRGDWWDFVEPHPVMLDNIEWIRSILEY